MILNLHFIKDFLQKLRLRLQHKLEDALNTDHQKPLIEMQEFEMNEEKLLETSPMNGKTENCWTETNEKRVKLNVVLLRWIDRYYHSLVDPNHILLPSN